MSYTAITTEGGLLPADMLDQLASGDVAGQRAEDFGLERNRRVSDEIATVWADARSLWAIFQNRLKTAGTSQTSVTRRSWIEPLLAMLGYDDLEAVRQAEIVDTRSYAISHRAGAAETGVPVHIEGVQTELDRRAPSGRPRLSPHALMQEFLNATDHVWGIITNGAQLRLLRDSAQVARPRYVEFDLNAMFAGEQFSEFALMYRLLHRTRLPRSSAMAAEAWIEHYHQQAIASGGRVRDGLRDGVETALKALGDGLVQHPHNNELRRNLDNGSLTPLMFYRQLLKLVYRLLFLMVAEERGLITVAADEDDALHPLHYRAQADARLQIYRDHYSVSRLRRMAEIHGVGRAPYDDVWLGLQTTFRLLEGSDEHGAQLLGLSPLNGDLFGNHAMSDFNACQIRNHAVLKAIAALSVYYDSVNRVKRRVNYAALDVEELGSVYESLLDYRPVISTHSNGQRSFDLVTGTERKTTGSYYTRPELVQELIKSALEPVMAQRLGNLKQPAQREQALLSITVCDPACGSGHFLLAAARRLARELAKIRSGEEQPTPRDFRHAVRDVIRQCIYGVDFNPLAVDLCKLALWIESHNAGTPLSFLDHHIRHGNSLVGASRALVEQGIPDDAFKPVTGDDKAIAAFIKKRNKQEREAWQHGAIQDSLFDQTLDRAYTALVRDFRAIEQMPDNNVSAIHAKEQRFHDMRAANQRDFGWFDLWTAAFFSPLTASTAPLVPTTKSLLDYRQKTTPLDPQMLAHANALSQQIHAFHWELEFPSVFDNGGFDVVLGNPPWERIKLQEQEHWVDVPEIRDALNKAAREKLLKQWQTSTDPAKRDRYAEFERAKYTAEATSRFIRASQRYPLTAVGDVNTYALFAELDRTLINPTGRTGFIVPTGIATDDSTKAFFGDLNRTQQLVSLYDFENREKLFAEVDSRMKFSLLTVGKTTEPTTFVFFATNPQHLNDDQRRYSLSAQELALINPNTLTSPVFRTKADAELTKKIYRRVPVLENERTGKNPWGVSFMTMFHMSNDSHLFKNEPAADRVPLYEAKMLHQFTHRWATYDGNETRDLTMDELQDPKFSVTPRYWMEQSDVEERLKNRWDRQWLLGFRRVARTNDERTSIFSILPITAAGDSVFLMMTDNTMKSDLVTCLLATLNSMVFDFVVRQKVGGVNFNFFIVKQLPVLPPEAFSDDDIAYIVPRVLELVYTAWDMQPFAEDVWNDINQNIQADILLYNQQCNRNAD
nr:N-6 DNA methylase [Herpetosiphon sp.]